MNLFEPLTSVFRFVFEGFYDITAAAGFASYGIAIIFMTILVKVLLYPLTAKQVRSMKAMQELQPALKKLQKDYKNNPQLLQQKMAELYKESGVNPLAGCLPLLIQMPILMGVYYTLYGYTYTGDPNFLWLTSLSETDPTYVLPVLSALTTYIQQKQTMANNGGDNQQMKVMSYMMPLFIGWISLSFPSGLVVYWVTMNICQIIQQWYMFRGERSQAASAKDADNGK